MKNVLKHLKHDLKSTVQDDRGKVFRRPQPVSLQMVMSKVELATFLRLIEKPTPPNRTWFIRWMIRLSMVAIVTAVVVGLGLTSAWIRIHWGAKEMWWFCFGGGFAFVSVLLGLSSIRESGWLTRYMRGMIPLRRCPVCTYNLSGLECEADGCTVCPECGAAWRLPDELASERSPDALHGGKDGEGHRG